MRARLIDAEIKQVLATRGNLCKSQTLKPNQRRQPWTRTHCQSYQSICAANGNVTGSDILRKASICHDKRRRVPESKIQRFSILSLLLSAVIGLPSKQLYEGYKDIRVQRESCTLYKGQYGLILPVNQIVPSGMEATGRVVALYLPSKITSNK
jgi:hypothetical protein